MRKKFFKTRFVAAMLPMAFAFNAVAADRQPALVVWNGERELFSFFVADNPQMTVKNGYAVIESDGEWSYDNYFQTITSKCSYQIPMSESQGYRITMEMRSYTGMYDYCDEDMLDGVENVAEKLTAPIFSMKDGVLQVAGLDEGCPVAVYSTDGKTLGKTAADRSGHATLPLQNMNGTAVVTAGSVTFKIVVK